MSRYDTVILGAGVTGLTIAGKLSASGTSDLCVIDEYPGLGGNHISRQIDGRSFDIGSFIFQPSDLLFDLFPGARPLLMHHPMRAARITPQGAVRSYPYSLKSELLEDGAIALVKAGASLLWGRLRYRRPRNSAQYVKSLIGGKVYRDSGLERYIARLFGIDAERIEIAFARKRLTWVERSASLRRRLGGQALRSPIPETSAVRPVSGFPALYAPIADTLLRRGVEVRLGDRLRRIGRDDEGLFVDTVTGRTRCERLIVTIPVQRAAALAGVGGGEGLAALDLASLYFDFEGERGFKETILYNFSDLGAWKRLTMHSDPYGRVHGREYFSVEAPVSPGEPDAFARLEQDFRSSVAAAGLFDGDLRFLDADRTAFAYPVYDEGASERADALIASLEKLGIEMAGRQGRFDYIPTAQLASRKALRQIGEAG